MHYGRVQNQKKTYRLKNKRLEWLFFLPGAAILSYGFWLSVTYS